MEKSIFDHTKEKVKELFEKVDIRKKKEELGEKVNDSYEKVYQKWNKNQDVKSYILFEGTSIVGLVNTIKEIVEHKNHMEVKEFTLEDGSVMLAARTQKGELKQLAGLDKAINIHIIDYKNGQIEVYFSEGKWMDKAFALTISCFTLWPLAALPGIGIYQQVTLVNDIINAMDEYFDIQ